MQPFERIQKYCGDVCDQIRWKKAKPMIAVEVEHHLCDQRDAYLSDGDDEKTATQKALEQMGDAVIVGQKLDQVHRPKPQWFMIALTGIFTILGMLIQYVLDTALHSVAPFAAFRIFPYILAFGILIGCYYLDFTVLGRHARKIYGLVVILSVMNVIVLKPNVYGKLVWEVGRFSISPAYLSFIFPLVFALFVYSMKKKGVCGILMSEAAFLPLAGVLLCVPTLSGLLLFMAAALIVLCFAICRGWFDVNKKKGLLLVFIPAAAAVVAVINTMPFTFFRRLKAVAAPLHHINLPESYTYLQIRGFLSNSVFWGKGDPSPYMKDIKKLPCIRTDYSLVYLIHQFGFVVLLGIVILIGLFSVIGIRKALKQKSVLGSLIALTIMVTFLLQSVVYILCNLGFGLVSSLSLPFLSFGSTALFLNAALTGFMLSVFRTGEIFCDASSSAYQAGRKSSHAVFSYEDGRIIINLKGGHI